MAEFITKILVQFYTLIKGTSAGQSYKAIAVLL